MKNHLFRIFLLGSAVLGLAVTSARAQAAGAAGPAPDQAVAAQPADQSATTLPAALPERDRFSLRLGAFLLSSIETTLSLSDSNGQIGDNVDFGRTLGADDSLNVFRADAEWNFAAKHKVQFSYFDINLTSKKVIDTSFEWGDQVYPVSATVNSHFNTTVYKLDYGYTFYRNQTHEINGLIGVHVTQFETGIGLDGTAVAENFSATAPLPLFGVEWKARLSEKLTSQVAYSYFGISLDDRYSGNLSDFQALLDYSLSRHWSVSAGYNRYTLRASVKGSRGRELTMRHSYNGLMVFLSTNF
jgi:hypothetical protein